MPISVQQDPDFQNFLQNLMQQIEFDYGKQAKAIAPRMARAGVLTSPYGQNPFNVLGQEQARKMAETRTGLGYQQFQTLQQREWQEKLAREEWERQEKLARELAEMYRPRRQDWWEPFLQPLATVGGFMLGRSPGGQ